MLTNALAPHAARVSAAPGRIETLRVAAKVVFSPISAEAGMLPAGRAASRARLIPSGAAGAPTYQEKFSMPTIRRPRHPRPGSSRLLLAFSAAIVAGCARDGGAVPATNALDGTKLGSAHRPPASSLRKGRPDGASCDLLYSFSENEMAPARALFLESAVLLATG